MVALRMSVAELLYCLCCVLLILSFVFLTGTAMATTVTTQIAKHIRDVHFGGNWTTSNLRDNLADVSWQEATVKVGSLNSIAALVFHINYYIDAVLHVLQGQPLTAHDKYSYEHPPIDTPEAWEALKQKMWSDAETFAALIEQLSDDTLWEHFTDEKYGHYYRNLQGIIEHTHYHLGQIVVIKKMVKSAGTA